MELVLINVCKNKDYFKKTRNVRKKRQSEKYNLRGQRNAIFHEKILSNKKQTNNFNFTSNSI